MLKELIRMWKKIDLLKESFHQFLEMIDMVEDMFRCSTDALFGARTCAEAGETLYRTDIKVNKTERLIRKQLVEHLAVNPRGDAPACLVLMSVSKDIERAGDYCKNLLEVAGMFQDRVTDLPYARDLRELADQVATTFRKTRRAFAEDDQVLGHEVIVEKVDISHRSDTMVEKIARDETLNANQAVCLALSFRFLKRINAHLGNVASGVVMPLHKLDYFDEKWDKEQYENNIAQEERAKQKRREKTDKEGE